MKYVRFTGNFKTRCMYVDGVAFHRSGDSFEFPLFLYDTVRGIGEIRRGLDDGTVKETRYDFGVPEDDEIQPYEDLPEIAPPGVPQVKDEPKEQEPLSPGDVADPSTIVDDPLDIGRDPSEDYVPSDPKPKKSHHKKAT